jgi:hypothetical protein
LYAHHCRILPANFEKQKMIEKAKSDCIESLSTALTSTSKWRLAIDARYPDHRNVRASKLLAKLAGEASSLSEAQWTALEPFVGSPRWGEAVKQTFVSSLARALSAPATVV